MINKYEDILSFGLRLNLVKTDFLLHKFLEMPNIRFLLQKLIAFSLDTWFET